MEEEEFGTGLQRTGPAGSCCDPTGCAEDRHKLLTTDNSNEEDSALQSYRVLQTAGVYLGWSVNTLVPGESLVLAAVLLHSPFKVGEGGKGWYHWL